MMTEYFSDEDNIEKFEVETIHLDIMFQIRQLMVTRNMSKKDLARER